MRHDVIRYVFAYGIGDSEQNDVNVMSITHRLHGNSFRLKKSVSLSAIIIIIK